MGVGLGRRKGEERELVLLMALSQLGSPMTPPHHTQTTEHTAPSPSILECPLSWALLPRLQPSTQEGFSTLWSELFMEATMPQALQWMRFFILTTRP